MRCPYCDNPETRVTDSRNAGKYFIRRRRECTRCKRRFTTYEHIELTPVYVIKKDGRREKFNREKLKTGIMKALEKRPVKLEKIEELIDSLEEKVRMLGKREVESSIIGEFVMEALKSLDEVAYIRFASVYRSFADITSFKEELRGLIKSKKEE
jgi:transcriptional repressor NrdR